MRNPVLQVSFWLTSRLARLVAVWLGFLSAVCLPPVWAAAEGVTDVIVVFKTHFDIGYTEMASNVVQRYRTTMIDQALTVCDRNRDLPAEQQFAWTLPGWPMKTILEDWPGQNPGRQQKILEAYRQGRFVTHALPFTTHTELLELEDLARGMNFSSTLSRRAGLPLPRDAKMTDVPSHAWCLVPLLKSAGVDFLHLGCNAGSTSPQVPELYWWEGPDGSRLLTMYSQTYGTGLIPPKDWPYTAWLALIHTGDNHGPPTPEEVKQVLDDARKKLPGVRVRIGRLSDFSDLILAAKPAIPVVRGDMPDTWIHGPLCDPEGASTARRVRMDLAALESLGTELSGWKVAAPAFQPSVQAAYEQSLLYGEHTWGGGLYWIMQYERADRFFYYGEQWQAARQKGDYRRIESSWEEHSDYARRARGLVAPALQAQLQALASSVHLDGGRIVVFNPLPWPRTGLVELPAPGPAIASLRLAEGGDPVPVECQNGRIRFLAREVPATGYRTYQSGPAIKTAAPFQCSEEAHSLESADFRLVLDPEAGVIRSVVEKRGGREWVEAGDSQGLGQYLYERFDAGQIQAFIDSYSKIKVSWTTNEFGKPLIPPASAAPYRAASPRPAKVRFETSPVSASAILETEASPEIPCRVTTRVTLYAGQAFLDLEVTLHDKPADPWPEACWMSLPLRIAKPVFQVGRLGSIIDPAKDIVPGANRHLLSVNTGLTVADDQGEGVGICPLDHAVVSLDQPGCWKFSRDFVPRRARVYVNMYNNQWSTNFRLWNGGTWTSRVRLWAVHGRNLASRLITPAMETRQPMIAAYTAGPAGIQSPMRHGLRVSQAGLIPTAFGPNPDGTGVLLRLWELSGQAGDCVVQLPEGSAFKTARLCDLRGQFQGGALPIDQGKFRIKVRPFAPCSMVLE